MSVKTLTSDESTVRQKAKRVLKLTSIESELAKFGKPRLLGSYKYKVMVAHEIDFHVIVPELNTDLANRFFQHVTSKNLYNFIYFKDKHLFNSQAAAKYPTKVALDCYSFCLRLVAGGEEWQISICFLTKHQKASDEIIALFENATDLQREQILKFKHLIANDLKVKVSSAYIYRAVLEENINEPKELLAYLESLGYSF